MTKIADIYAQRSGEPLFICDFSPPRGAVYNDLGFARLLVADCLSVPYNPGKSVYANSALAAHSLRIATGKDVVFTVATRDMNILAAQSLLLGGAMLGLDNLIVVRGDDFTAAELRRATPVHDSTPTALIRSIAAMNEGTDFRGRTLDSPTDFCIGATIDTNRTLEVEVALTRRKIDAGAHFLITQPGFTPDSSTRFLQAYEQTYHEHPSVPIFFGVQMTAPGSRSFSPIPQSIRDDMDKDIPSADIAIRAVERFLAAGITAFYLMPSIFPGGARDYHSAQTVLSYFKTDSHK